MGLINYNTCYIRAAAILELAQLNPGYLKGRSKVFPVGTNWELLMYTLVDLSIEIERVREPSFRSRLKNTVLYLEQDLELLLSGEKPKCKSWKAYGVDVTGGVISFYRGLIQEIEIASRTPGGLGKPRGNQYVGAVIERGLELVDLHIARTTTGQLRFHITTGVVEMKRFLEKLERRDQITQSLN